jgi:hypothetical protein
MSEILAVQAALLGPAAAGVLWLAGSRWRVVRRIVGGAAAVAAHGAAWWVLWLTYRGDQPMWRSFQPDLLGASVAVAAEVAILFAVVRADGLGRWAPGAVCGLAVAASALVGTAYATSLPVQAVLIPISTLALAGAALAGRSRPDLRGLAGLAAADGVALLGLSVVYARVEGTEVVPEGGILGMGLLLAAAAVKAGAVPGLGTWSTAASDGPGAPVSVAVRGQGVALALLAGMVIGRTDPQPVVAGVAATALLLAGASATVVRSAPQAAAAIAGTAAALLFVALGLGGAVGIRAALILFPPFLVAVGSAFALGWAPRVDDAGRGRRPVASPEPRAGWRWLGAVGLAVAVVSLAGLPLGGGFPGAWLAVSLAGIRGSTTAPYLLVAGAVGLGLALAALGAVPLVRSARARPVPAILGTVAAAVLLYMSVQPVRLGAGWWIRIERDLQAPALLAPSGAPALPPVGGLNLAAVTLEAVLLVGLVVLVAGGFRDVRTGFLSIPTRVRATRAVAAARRVRENLESVGLGVAVAMILEVGAIVLAGRLVFLAARSGFL